MAQANVDKAVNYLNKSTKNILKGHSEGKLISYGLVIFTWVVFATICISGLGVYEGACSHLEEDASVTGKKLFADMGNLDNLTISAGAGVSIGGILMLFLLFITGIKNKNASSNIASYIGISFSILMAAIPVFIISISQWQIDTLQCKYTSLNNNTCPTNKLAAAPNTSVTCTKSLGQWSSAPASADATADQVETTPPAKDVWWYKFWKMARTGSIGFPIGMLITFILIEAISALHTLVFKQVMEIDKSDGGLIATGFYLILFGVISLVAAGFSSRYIWLNAMCVNKGGFNYSYDTNGNLTYDENKGLIMPKLPGDIPAPNPNKGCGERDIEDLKNAKFWQTILIVIMVILLVITLGGIGGGIGCIAMVLAK